MLEISRTEAIGFNTHRSNQKLTIFPLPTIHLQCKKMIGSASLMPGHIADFMYAVENWKLVTLNLDLNKEPQSVFDFKESQENLRTAALLSCFGSRRPRRPATFGLQTLDHAIVTHLRGVEACLKVE